MSRHWEYPLYLIQHGGGYASIVSEEDGNEQSLVVCRDAETAFNFMGECGILGAPRALHNDREFSWLLQSLQGPVTQVVFNPSSQKDEADSGWWVSVRELLDRHLKADNSPWNYPIYVAAQASGFVSIEGQGDEGLITAIGVFTSEARVHEYLAAAEEEAEVCEVRNLDDARVLLSSLAPDVVAVALDPVVMDGQSTARHCFAIETLLDKYLVRRQ